MNGKMLEMNLKNKEKKLVEAKKDLSLCRG